MGFVMQVKDKEVTNLRVMAKFRMMLEEQDKRRKVGVEGASDKDYRTFLSHGG